MAEVKTYPLEYWIKIGEFFLNPENSNKKADDFWSFEKAYSLLFEFARQIDPSLRENPSFFEILTILKKPNAQDFINSQAVNRDILKFWEEEKNKAEELKKAFQKELERKKEVLEAAQKLAQESAQRLSQKQAGDPQAVAQAVVDEIGVQADYQLSLQKAEKLDEEKRTEAERKIADEIQESIRQAAIRLEEEGKISSQEAKALENTDPRANLELIADQLSLPSVKRDKMTAWLTEQVAPIEQAQEKINIILPAFLEQLPQTNIKNLSPEEIEEAAAAAMAEVAPELGEITPGEVSKIIHSLTPQTEEEVALFSTIINAPKEERITSPLLNTEPIEATQIPSSQPRFIAAPFQRASEANPTHFRNEKNTRLIDELKRQLYREGINTNNASFFRDKTLEGWSIYLSAERITPEDIDFTIKRLLAGGEQPDSERIRELQEIRVSLASFQNKIPNTLLGKIKKQGINEAKKGHVLVQIPSRFRTDIIRRGVFKSTGFNSFLGKVLGRKTIFSASGQAIFINKLTYSGFRFIEGFKKYFFNTAFGGGIKFGLQRLAQNSMQGIFGAAKTIFKQGFGSFAKIGLQILAPGVGKAVLALGKIASPLKLGKLFGSGMGIFGNFIGGLTGARDVPKNKDFNFLVPVITGVFVGLFAIVFFNIDLVDKGAMLTPGIGSTENIPPETLPPECINTRDFSEKVICIITYGQHPCDHHFIKTDTSNDVSQCLLASELLNKQTLQSVFSNLYAGFLQCVGFVDGIQKARGRDMGDQMNACQYLDNPPTGYTYINGTNSPKKEDVVVWSGIKCGGVPRFNGDNWGHMAIVIEVDSTLNYFLAAEANGFTGEVRIRKYIYGTPNDGVSPNAFLRSN